MSGLKGTPAMSGQSHSVHSAAPVVDSQAPVQGNVPANRIAGIKGTLEELVSLHEQQVQSRNLNSAGTRPLSGSFQPAPADSIGSDRRTTGDNAGRGEPANNGAQDTEFEDNCSEPDTDGPGLNGGEDPDAEGIPSQSNSHNTPNSGATSAEQAAPNQVPGGVTENMINRILDGKNDLTDSEIKLKTEFQNAFNVSINNIYETNNDLDDHKFYVSGTGNIAWKKVLTTDAEGNPKMSMELDLASNGSNVEATKEANKRELKDLELHLLLESAFNNAVNGNTDQAVSLTDKIFSASPVFVPYHDRHGGNLPGFAIYASSDPNFTNLKNRMGDSTHRLQETSGNDNKCWIRSAYLAALTRAFQTEDLTVPPVIENNLIDHVIEKLNPCSKKDEEDVRLAITGLVGSLSKPEVLREENVGTFEYAKEMERTELLKSISEKLLRKYFDTANSNEANEFMDVFKPQKLGTDEHVHALISALGVDCICISKKEATKKTETADAEPAKVEVSMSKNIALQFETKLEAGPKSAESYQASIEELMKYKPVVYHSGGNHFCVLLPKALNPSNSAS